MSKMKAFLEDIEDVNLLVNLKKEQTSLQNICKIMTQKDLVDG